MGASIDRRGRDSVISGYNIFHDQSGCAYFSVWQTKTLKFANNDNNLDKALELLEENLEMIESSGTQSIYTLRVHKTTDSDGMISDKTPYYGSFNFTVYDANGATQKGISPMSNNLYLELKAMREELQDLREEKAAGVGSIMTQEDLIFKILDHPLTQQISGLLINTFTGNKNSSDDMFRKRQQAQQQQQRQGLAGTQTEEEAEAEIVTAVQRLYAIDRDIPGLLTKLADLAENNPTKYKMAKSFL